jgi:GAF domain-containing protein
VGALVAVHAAGDQADVLKHSRIALGDRLSGWVGATRQVILNSDARLDLDEESRAGSPLRSALAVPVESGARLIGVLSLYAPDVNAFDEAHRRVTQLAAAAVAESRSFTGRDSR